MGALTLLTHNPSPPIGPDLRNSSRDATIMPSGANRSASRYV
jgi:hypothetical protein